MLPSEPDLWEASRTNPVPCGRKWVFDCVQELGEVHPSSAHPSNEGTALHYQPSESREL